MGKSRVLELIKKTDRKSKEQAKKEEKEERESEDRMRNEID